MNLVMSAEKTSGTAVDSLARRYADMFVELFGRIEGGWNEPWIRAGARPAQNMSGNVYKGANRLLLNLYSSIRGYDMPVWMTFHQAKDAGLNIQKGSRSLPVSFYDFYYLDRETGRRSALTEAEYKALDQLSRERYIPKCILKYYSVFNIGQTDFAQKYPVQYEELQRSFAGEAVREASVPLLDDLVSRDGWECAIERSDAPGYSRVHDVISMPGREAFADGSRYYGTLLHLMAHSTGSEMRLDRDITGGSLDAVSREEMVAELASASVCAVLGLQALLSDDNLRYLGSWSAAVDDDPMVIYEAVRDSSRAADYISESLGLSVRQGVDVSSLLEKTREVKEAQAATRPQEDVKRPVKLSKH
jgi:antirestriction protein ArdC